MEEEEIRFVDSDTYRGDGSNKFQLTYSQIVMSHINRCVVNGSVEYRGGFYENRISSQGQVGTQIVKTYVDSKIDIFCNSVKILKSLLFKWFNAEETSKVTKLNQDINTYSLKNKYKGVSDKDEKANLDEDKITLYFELFEILIAVAKRENFFRESTEEGEVI